MRYFSFETTKLKYEVIRLVSCKMKIFFRIFLEIVIIIYPYFLILKFNGLEKNIYAKESKGRKTYYVNCVVREKEIQLKPEEIVRQLYAYRLILTYSYPKRRIKFEHPVPFGREIKIADIIVFDKDRPETAFIIVELKKPKLSEGKSQLRPYCNATGAPIGVWTNGEQISHYRRKDPNYFEDITDIPNVNQTLKDILKERYTLKDLIIKDKILNEGKSLKDIIKEMEDEVLANAGVDVFKEVFKLIFTKLYDELQNSRDKLRIEDFLQLKLTSDERANYEIVKETLSKIDDSNFRVLEFRNTGQTDTELFNKTLGLFDTTKGNGC